MKLEARPAILDRKVLHDGYLTVESLKLKVADGAEVSREVESHGDAVAVLPYDGERSVALTVRLMRPPVLDATGKPEFEEACAGMIEDGQAADQTARREVREELGVELRRLEPAGLVCPAPPSRPSA